MKPSQISFLESVAQSADKEKWQDLFNTLIEDIKDDVLSKKISVDAGNEAIEKLRQVSNKITILDRKDANPSKNPAM